MSPPDKVAFVLKLGRAMHASGYAAHRLEEVLAATAQRLGLDAQFFSTPTSIFAAFGRDEHQRTYLLRVEPGDVDLGRLAHLDRVLLRVLSGELTATAGAGALDALATAPPRYGGLITALAFGLTSAAAGRFLGGGLVEIAVAAVIGLATGLLAAFVRVVPRSARIFEALAAFTAAVIAAIVSIVVAPHSVFVATLAGLIVLIPGFTLTVAMNELATRHLVSGTARLSGALLIFLTIIFGVAIGNRLVQALLGAPLIVEPVGLPLWTELVALFVAPLGFAILLRAELRDLPWIQLAGWLAFGGARLGGMALGPELGVFVGALTVGVASNLYALALDRPSQIPLVPGVLLLVPGSIGFRSLASLLDRQVISGVETAFTMVLMATALVAGLLVANVVVPRRKSG
jgi:uncharacterized membrane protein YjjP (DUF1212 family)